MEIERLHNMLTEAGIEREWVDRTPKHWVSVKGLANIKWGWQIIVYKENGDRLVSAIEGWGTYGFGIRGIGGDENDSDLIEIMGLLTPEEGDESSVVGWLTAEEVFRRIKEALC